MSSSCRFCGKEDLSVTNSVLNHLEEIKNLLKIELKLDSIFPSKFCNECLQKLQSANEFVRICLQSEENLEETFKKPPLPPLPCDDDDDDDYFNDDVEFTRGASPETKLLLNLGESITIKGDADRFGQKGWKDKKYIKHVIKKKSLKLEVKPVEKVEQDECLRLSDDDWVEEEKKEIQKPAKPQKPKLPKNGPFKCETCNKTYANKSSFNTHFYIKHVCAGRQFICEECGKMYAKAGQLKEHLNVHLAVKPYSCDLCGSRFARKYAVVNHMLSHTKTKRYQCAYCPKAYTFYSDIKRHETVHTGKYIYNCTICKKGYNRKKQLHEHERDHLIQS